MGSASPTRARGLLQWVGHIVGPPDSPYQQRVFYIAIVFPENYPLMPFQLSFTTPLFHPNVSDEGNVYLAELQTKHWSPVLTVRTILVCLQALLSDPDLSQGVLNSEAATLYATNRDAFMVKASR